MSGAIILNEDWSEYDKKKVSKNEDISIFNCTEEWEVKYLVNVLHVRFEFLLSDNSIIKAINATCLEKGSKVSRIEFVDQLMLKLIS